jgi:hypothetical protein
MSDTDVISDEKKKELNDLNDLLNKILPKTPMYNPERGAVTAMVGSVLAAGSWGVEGNDGYFEWDDLEIHVDGNGQRIVLFLGEKPDDGAISLDPIAAAALRALLEVAIQSVK